MSSWAEWRPFLQENEVKTIKSLLPSSKLKILEIGGGDGIKSMFLHNLGYEVTCVDITPWEQQFYPVEKIEKNQLPFSSETFDVILSANVLPVVSDKKQFFNELDRVLKTNGIAIHVIPSPWWSVFTNFWHYVFIPKYLARSLLHGKTPLITSDISNSSHVKEDVQLSYKIKRLFLHPIGDNPSFLHEIFYFTKNSWIVLFKSHNYNIAEIKNEPLFFTAYGVFKGKYLKSRRILGRMFPTQYYFKIIKINQV